MSENYCGESNTLIFKNIPKQIDDLGHLLNSLQIPAKQIKPFGRKRALIAYESKSETDNALEKIRELEFAGKAPNISLFCKEKPIDDDGNKIKAPTKTCKSHKGVQTCKETPTVRPMNSQQVNKYVQKLYATEENLCFDQPPPPYLKYQYPPISKDILDNISTSLLNNKKFYTQVLHLMNRMNLEPPFRERKERFYPKGEPKEAFTQTEVVVIGEYKQKTDSESELESSDENNVLKQPQIVSKRKLPPSDDQYKKKARQMLQTMQKFTKETVKKQVSVATLQGIFEDSPTSKAHSSKINLYITPADTPKIIDKTTLDKPNIEMRKEVSAITSKSPLHDPKFIHESEIDFPLDLTTQCIGAREMQELAIFRNYKKGDPSNKLYIKNLQKDVITEDLHALYRRVIQNDSVRLEIKVMQHGRMKGQAFVTFHCENLRISDLQEVVSKALECTNGFILRQKPMVVCFGKQS